MQFKLKGSLKGFRVKLEDLFNNPLLTAVMDAASKLFPNKSKNEDVIRACDREAVQRGDFGQPVTHAPGLSDGRLNRSKILMGVPIFYETDTVTPEDFPLIRDAGFDFIISEGGNTFRTMVLDESLKNGLAVISRDPHLPRVSESSDGAPDFSGYKKHPAQVGDTGWDEPNTSAFKIINAYEQAYRKALPGQFLFNNLFPDGATKKQLGAKSYKEYVDSWADTVHSDYISLDHYPFYATSLMNKIGFRLALNTYDCVGDACRRTGRDFWIYTQTQGCWFSHLYLLVTYEQIKWQIYTALCYGARSIIQVAYTPVWGNDAYAMKDKTGSLTEQYLYAKRINAEIQKLSPVLSPYRSLGVLCADAKHENPDFRLAVRKQNKSSRTQGFYGIPEVKSIRSQSTVLAGFFADAQKNKALMLVNCRDTFDANASQRITVALSGDWRVRVYLHGELTQDCITNTVQTELGSCDGAFITLDRITFSPAQNEAAK